jgi:hypothetical protein
MPKNVIFSFNTLPRSFVKLLLISTVFNEEVPAVTLDAIPNGTIQNVVV